MLDYAFTQGDLAIAGQNYVTVTTNTQNRSGAHQTRLFHEANG
jgi:hypothetical protein